jgi:small subunit ribosomal protein S6
MSEIKNVYETMFIVNSTIGEDAVKTAVEKFKALISANGELTKIEEIGKRRLAYPIMKMNEGYYVLCEFSSGPEFICELDRIFNITDEIIRSLTIRKGE